MGWVEQSSLCPAQPGSEQSSSRGSVSLRGHTESDHRGKSQVLVTASPSSPRKARNDP